MANEKPTELIQKKQILIALAVLGAIGLVVFVFWAVPGRKMFRAEQLMSAAPEIEFELPNGDRTALSRMQGSTILINFWASWCAPCMEEMPSLRMLQEHYRDRGLVVLAFNISESREQIRGTVTGDDLPENLIFNFNKEFLRPYKIDSIPISILIDSLGVIRQTYVGPRNWVDFTIRREIEGYLPQPQ